MEVVMAKKPSEQKGIIVVADNEAVARAAVDAMVVEAEKKMAATGKKLKPLVLMGDLADPNAVQRRAGRHPGPQAPSDRNPVPVAGLGGASAHPAGPGGVL